MDWTAQASEVRAAIAPIARAAVDAHVTPGGVVAVADRGTPAVIVPFGRTQTHPSGAGSEVGTDTIYDIASLTKPVATSAVLMKLLEAGAIALDTPARSLLPELVATGSDEITIAQLAGHAAGFPDHVKFYERLWSGDRAGAVSAREALVRMAGATPLVAPPGKMTRYSDVGYILLGAALERAAGERLDRAAARLVLEPLAMHSAFFVDLEVAPSARPAPSGPIGSIAPTELCPRRGLLVGEVHDENAHAAGGVCGHAGLFATAGDVARFAAAMCAAVAGEPGWFSPAAARALVRTESTPGSTWRLGWDTPAPAPGASQAGDRWPRDGLGHLAFTGCSMWLDPPRGRHVVILTNRVHPTRQGTGIRELRRAIMDAAVTALDGPI
ncbi:MAG TPA: serine hydrolase domain-containing protein [Kofleriaceae bacterium]|nr:serine hydrolase domain-containing protein [Kofleriaceae bacterium]